MDLTINDAYTIQAQGEDATIDAVFVDKKHTYIVERYRLLNSRLFEFRLAIKRADKSPIRNWRLLQDLKNAAVGFDRTAIEIYPAEQNVTDTANIYHLWVYRSGCEPSVELKPPECGV